MLNIFWASLGPGPQKLDQASLRLNIVRKQEWLGTTPNYYTSSLIVCACSQVVSCVCNGAFIKY